MRHIALAGFLATLLFVSAGQVSAQGEESLQDTVEMASGPIVVERDLFTLTLDVGVFIERVCISVEPLRSLCEDILVLLKEHRVRSDLAEEIRTDMEEMLRESVIAAMEQWVTEQIQQQIEELKKIREAGAP